MSAAAHAPCVHAPRSTHDRSPVSRPRAKCVFTVNAGPSRAADRAWRPPLCRRPAIAARDHDDHTTTIRIVGAAGRGVRSPRPDPTAQPSASKCCLCRSASGTVMTSLLSRLGVLRPICEKANASVEGGRGELGVKGAERRVADSIGVA